jgi:aminoglycoside 6'-N-acetyltransferase I
MHRAPSSASWCWRSLARRFSSTGNRAWRTQLSCRDGDVFRRVISIRSAEPGDAAQWIALRAALWPDEDPTSLAAEVARFFAEPESRRSPLPEAVLVAADADRQSQLVGFAELSRRAYAEGCETSPVGFLEGWYVVPQRRRQGVGRALVTAAEAWARSLGCREFASDALAENTVSATAHRALGFEEVEVIRCFRKDLI